jgi:hypothetical protein
MERGQRQHADLRGALVKEVRRLAQGRSHEPEPANVGVEFTRSKVEPMVRGPDYFAEGDPFADFIVHEAAHIFHNCQRQTIRLREMRRNGCSARSASPGGANRRPSTVRSGTSLQTAWTQPTWRASSRRR